MSPKPASSSALRTARRLGRLSSTNKTFNYGHYNNPEYDALLKASYEERDPAKRYQILHDAEVLLMKEVGVAPLMVYASPWLVDSKVKGWQDNAANEHLSRFLSIEWSQAD